MAPSLPDNLCVCGVLLALALTGGAQEAGGEEQELVLDSGPLAFNGQTNLFEVETPQIRQGDVYITADRAVAHEHEFDESSEWRFTGNVRIEVDTAVMEAASAVFTFADEQLSRGELEGTPVSFSDVDAVTKSAHHGPRAEDVVRQRRAHAARDGRRLDAEGQDRDAGLRDRLRLRGRAH